MQRIAIFITLLLTQSGCLTAAVWQSTGQSRIHVSNEYAVTNPYAPDKRPALVISYETSENGRIGFRHTEYQMVLPSNAAGYPAWPLLVTGHAVTRQEIVLAVGEQQARDLRTFVFSDENRKSAKRLTNLPQRDRALGTYAIGIPELHCRAIGLNAVGDLVSAIDEADENGQANFSHSSFPRGTQVVLIPEEQPLPAGHRAKAIVGATIATPFTLAIDVVLAPVFLIMFATGHAPC